MTSRHRTPSHPITTAASSLAKPSSPTTRPTTRPTAPAAAVAASQVVKPTPTSRPYTVVRLPIAEEDEGDEPNADEAATEAAAEATAEPPPPPHQPPATTTAHRQHLPPSDNDAAASDNNDNNDNVDAASSFAHDASSSSSPRPRVRSCNEIIGVGGVAVGGGGLTVGVGGGVAVDAKSPYGRSLSTPSGPNAMGAAAQYQFDNWNNGDIWVHVQRMKRENLERQRKQFVKANEVAMDSGSVDSGVSSEDGSGGGRKKEKSCWYQPFEQAAIASGVINTLNLQSSKLYQMEGISNSSDLSSTHSSSSTASSDASNSWYVGGGGDLLSNPSIVVNDILVGGSTTAASSNPANAPNPTFVTSIITPTNTVNVAPNDDAPILIANDNNFIHTASRTGFNDAGGISSEQISQYIASASLVPPFPHQISGLHSGHVLGGGGGGLGGGDPSLLRPGELTPAILSATPPLTAGIFTPVMLSMQQQVGSRRVSSSSSSDDEYESEVVEESPCRRWQKRKETVMQNDIPGCDGSYLAMDTEEGFEVVWSELLFSERKKFKDQQEKIADIFDYLIQLDHPNIMKFHHYWMDAETNEKPRVVFIKEYMSSGSLAHFMRKTRMNKKKLQMKSWKRWSNEILSALSYLHDTCTRYGDGGIIHGNLSCDTVFIQQNGTIKIGSVSLEAINHHVKTCRDQIDHRYFAPEYAFIDAQHREKLSTAADIYAFGVLALVMATALHWPSTDGHATPRHASDDEGGGGLETTTNEPPETKLEASLGNDLQMTINRLENPLQRDFLRLCLAGPVSSRASAKELLAHPALTDGLNSLTVLAATAVLTNRKESRPAIGKRLADGLPNHADVFAERTSPRATPLIFNDIAATGDLTAFAKELIEDGATPLRALLHHRQLTGGCGPASLVGDGAVAASWGGGNGVIGDAAGAANVATEWEGEGGASASMPEMRGLDSFAAGAEAAGDGGSGGGGGGGADSLDGTLEPETRTILQMSCSIQRLADDESGEKWSLTLLFRLSDKMNRQLTAIIGSPIDTAPLLVDELVHFAFIAAEDRERVTDFLAQNLTNRTLHPRHSSSVDSFFEEQLLPNAETL